jgi:PII-like signaling protein
MLQAQIFIDKNDLQGDRPLYEFIMQFLLLHQIKGATAYKGMMGFGVNQQMKRPDQIFSFDDPPILITFIDEAVKVLDVLKQLRIQYKGGFIITHVVDQFDA